MDYVDVIDTNDEYGDIFSAKFKNMKGQIVTVPVKIKSLEDDYTYTVLLSVTEIYEEYLIYIIGFSVFRAGKYINTSNIDYSINTEYGGNVYVYWDYTREDSLKPLVNDLVYITLLLINRDEL